MARKCGGARSERKPGIDSNSVTRYIRRPLDDKNDHRRRATYRAVLNLNMFDLWLDKWKPKSGQLRNSQVELISTAIGL